MLWLNRWMEVLKQWTHLCARLGAENHIFFFGGGGGGVWHTRTLKHLIHTFVRFCVEHLTRSKTSTFLGHRPVVDTCAYEAIPQSGRPDQSCVPATSWLSCPWWWCFSFLFGQAVGVYLQESHAHDMVLHVLKQFCPSVNDYIIERKPCRYLVVKSFAAAQDTIYKALEASHLHYENIFKDVVRNLTSNTSAPTSQALHLPTLLTSRAAATERKDQDDTD